MRVTVRLFAGLRELSGMDRITLDLGRPSSPREVWEILCERYPCLRAYQGRTLMTVNRRYVTSEHVLVEGDELAFLPPVSGG